MRRIWHISPLKIYNLEFESPVFVKTVKWHLFLVRKKRFLKNGGKRRYNEKNRGNPRFFVCHLLRTLILAEKEGFARLRSERWRGKTCHWQLCMRI